MQLSTFNKLLKFFSVEYVPDDIGGFTKKYEYLFTLYGEISLLQIDKHARKKYQLTIDSRASTLSDLNELIVVHNNQQFVIKNISVDKQLIKMECYDNQNTEDLI